ncbi:dephospho-CoA kinase [bacterium]|nr:dephospho-CoA kinase [bacterium]
MKIGVGGGIGAGKSTVCRMFSRFGARVFDTDGAAKSLYVRPDIRQKTEALLGTDVYEGDAIVPSRVSERLFSDPTKLRSLEAYLHPAVAELWAQFAQDAERQGRWAIKESALLLRDGRPNDVDVVVWVSAPEAIRIERVQQRSGLALPEIVARMRRQPDEAAILHWVDGIVLNDGVSLLLPQIARLRKELIENHPRP